MSDSRSNDQSRLQCAATDRSATVRRAPAKKNDGMVRLKGGRTKRTDERRLFPRLPLHLTVRVKRVAGQPEAAIEDLQTSDISCNGLYFFAGRKLEPGTPIDLEVVVVELPGNGPTMRMFTTARVVRLEALDPSGWHGVGATFEDVTLDGYKFRCAN